VEALGRSQGRFSTKIHLRTEGRVRLMTFSLTPSQAHELSAAEHLLRHGAVKRARVGRPRLRPKRTVGDQGYSSPRFRHFLRQRSIRYTFPRRTDQVHTGPFDRAVYCLRNQVERLINRLKHLRRIATRYEKRATSYATMLTLAATLLWLKFQTHPGRKLLTG
jgi:transposase